MCGLSCVEGQGWGCEKWLRAEDWGVGEQDSGMGCEEGLRAEVWVYGGYRN